MTVYVNDEKVDVSFDQGAHSKCCVMWADSQLELEEMAYFIGVKAKYLRVDADGSLYYLVSQSKRAAAISEGAKSVKGRSLYVGRAPNTPR